MSDVWSTPRRRIPRRVVVAAYGDGGRDWLFGLASKLRRVQLLDRLIANAMLQLWCVDARDVGSLDRGLQVVRSDSEPSLLRELLEAGAGAEARVDFPNVDMHSILVLERWSLFDEASVGRRSLRSALAIAARAGCESGAPPELDYEWISLLDSVRPAAAVPTAVRGRVRELMTPDELANRMLLIDRVDAGNAVISKALANECYASTVVALLTSDAAFLPADGSGVKLFDSDPVPDAVVPIAIVNLHHPIEGIRSAVAEHIRQRLAVGSLDASNARWSPSVPTLEKLAELEIGEIASGVFSPRSARDRRERSARELLRVVFATRGRDSSCREQIDLAAARIRQALRSGNETDQPLAAVGALAVWPSVSLTVVALALAAIGVAVQRRRSRQSRSAGPANGGGGGAGHSGAADLRAAAEASRQWAELASRLSPLTVQMSKDVRSRPATELSESGATWSRSGANPFDWTLVGDPLPRADIAPLTDQEYAELAERCLRLLNDGRAPEEILDTAIEEMAQEKLRYPSSLAGAVARAAFSQEHAREITESLGQRDTPLLASTPANSIGDVYWIGDMRVVACEDLLNLEPVATKSVARCAAHDDPERTTRLAFGKPIPWRTVISLSSIGL